MNLIQLGLFILATGCYANEKTHKYKPKDVVHLWVNKIGPYANPQEAYPYYSLPYCHPKHEAHEEDGSKGILDGEFDFHKVYAAGKHGEWSTAEILGGHKLKSSGYSIFFPKNTHSKVKTEKECRKVLSEKEAKLFEKAVLERYFYQFYLDELPVWGMVGELVDPETHEIVIEYSEDAVPHIYTHRTLIITYDQKHGRIISVDINSEMDSLAPIKAGSKLSFQLDVKWEENDSDLTYENRFERYLDSAFFAHTIHWFSLLNSGMMVLFLLGMMSFILLRTLRRDILKSSSVRVSGDIETETLINDEGELSGWKILSTEVFRAPLLLPLLSALLGTGVQVLFTAIGVTLFCVLGPLHGDVYESRDEMLSAIINTFTLSALISGYYSGRFFKIWAGQKSAKMWQLTMGLTLVLLPFFFIVIFGTLNALNIFYGTIYILPFWSVVTLFALYICISIPLGVVGTIVGRASVRTKPGNQYFPCRTNTLARPIPEDLPFYATWKLSLISGLFPFGSIFIELYYVLTSLWNYKFYHVYFFMLTVGVILVCVTAMTGVLSTYLLLQHENYFWQWNAFFGGASTGFYILLYSVYYFVFRTNMYGLLQTAYYFCYTAILSVTFGLMCGAISFISSSYFVVTIFRNIKSD